MSGTKCPGASVQWYAGKQSQTTKSLQKSQRPTLRSTNWMTWLDLITTWLDDLAGTLNAEC
jgi:hypothetical protein